MSEQLEAMAGRQLELASSAPATPAPAGIGSRASAAQLI
jgi:hypothetical protein